MALDGDEPRARRLAHALLERLETIPGGPDVVLENAGLKGFAQLSVGRPSDAIATLSALSKTLSPGSRDVLARAYLASGQRGKAETIVSELKKQGYAHPAFLAFWRDSPVGGIRQVGGVK